MQQEISGLTQAQAEQRRAAGQGNAQPVSPTKTMGQIVRDNTLTYFNLVFVVLAAMLALVRSWANMAFLVVVVCNTVIGIVQQLRAKRTIDRLTLVAAHKIPCLRDGTWTETMSDNLVLGDVVRFAAGDQIAADAVVLDGAAQANEALVTGEERAVPKAAGDTLRSGSFLMNGEVTARLTAVGADSYANRLADEARRDGHRVAKGEMMRSLDKLIRGIGIALIPLGAAMLAQDRLSLALPVRDSVESTVAALVGMIPEGLYLLTSVALAVSMIRLARGRVLTRDMNSIETLARVDVLCVDKTGTVTEAAMQADDPVPLPGADAAALPQILASLYGGQPADNATARALCARFAGGAPWPAAARLPFNTAYKFAGADFGEQGVYLVGAPDVLAGARRAELAERLDPLLAEGCRVLLLARVRGTLPGGAAPQAPAAETLELLALLPLQNRIRATAPETFRYFAAQGVTVKVISGDDPRAVSRVAQRAGIAGAQHYVDAAALQTDAALEKAAASAAVFGRVTPEQKRRIVRALQAQGHTVAMTGDGVNDVLALKDADCGIAMAGGAQAAGQVAQFVLLDADFAALPKVVAEGRRVINNIQRSAELFLVKNIFSFLLAAAALLLSLQYPFQPVQLSLVSAVTIGVPSFFLALEPNRERVRGRFLPGVLRAAAPGGLTDFVLVLAALGLGKAMALSQEQISTVSTLILLAVGLTVLYDVCRPFTARHRALWGGCAAAGILGAVIFAEYLQLVRPVWQSVLALALLLALVRPALSFFTRCAENAPRLFGKGKEPEKNPEKKPEKG